MSVTALIMLSMFPDHLEVSTNHIRHRHCFSPWKITIKKLSIHVHSSFVQAESHKAVHTATHKYTQIHPDIHSYTQIHTATHRYTQIHTTYAVPNEFLQNFTFTGAEHLNATLSWLQGDNTCCGQIVSGINLTPHNNNYPLSNFNHSELVTWPFIWGAQWSITIWSISQCALFEIWQMCPILLESWSCQSISMDCGSCL
jgi:hypothetical protein